MKKIGIVTIIDYHNVGNRLQNYALQEFLKQFSYQPITILNSQERNDNDKKYYLRILKNFFQKKNSIPNKKRRKAFLQFNNNIEMTNKIISIKNMHKLNDFCFFVTGSDQVWNPNFGRLRDMDLLNFETTAKKVSYAASFSCEQIPDRLEIKLKKALSKFSGISVREEAGKKLLEKYNIRSEVVLDPTLLLNVKDYEKIIIIPDVIPNKPFLFIYFLGTISYEISNYIFSFAKKHNLEIVDFCDQNSPYYENGPSEFLYFIQHADFVLTNSFHAIVFSILFKKNFYSFGRNIAGQYNMNSRIHTILSNFSLQNRLLNNFATFEKKEINYNHIENILDEKRRDSLNYLSKVLGDKND